VSNSNGVMKDGQEWRVGTDADVAWIRDATPSGLEITSAIPPLFDAYATIVLPEPGDSEGLSKNAASVLRDLGSRAGRQPWWLGYLDTSGIDRVFVDLPQVTLYSGWTYELVLAGPDEALRWRFDDGSDRPGPDLVFPADRSWLMSWLWDDEWRCLGGPSDLIDHFVDAPRFEARRVALGEDATPPGRIAR